MIRRPPRSTQSRSSAASDVYKRQFDTQATDHITDRADRLQQAPEGAEQAEEDQQADDVARDVPTFRQPGIDAVEQGAQGHGGQADPVVPAFAQHGRDRGEQGSVSYTHLRAHETVLDLVCRLLLEKKKTIPKD
eukprot:TRINITY_DN22616_c0_g1_i1.p1 TRINITY_DN22616_c0_g1~~TRINITY_DN22616_c0_g1_i1.p1  ORF type:complete len:134 (-),score=64.74 TRINITY_DN22616_c0_g1_i1:66-467(-)